ncbi:D-2-hydroxyacid dehydrogenase [Thermodesulfobacteriota bacterium]
MNKLLVLTPKADVYATLLKGLNLSGVEIDFAATLEEGRRFVSGAVIILGVPTMVAELLPKAEQLLWVQSTFAGIEALCVTGMRRDYLLTGVKGVFGPLMSEYVLAYILALERHLFEIRQNQIDKYWKEIAYGSLKDLTLGICGLGSIGRHIAQTAACFGMRVLGFKRSREKIQFVDRVYPFDKFYDFLKEPDYVVVTLPLTRETKHLFTTEAIKRMKPSAVLINIGRGPIVVESDLIRALENRTIRGAVLDVFENEPLSTKNSLWKLPNAIITPHNAGVSFPKDIVKIFRDNYDLFQKNRTLNFVVDFDKGY